ncbi:uncharacterized protein [Aquarana catesbeiana]|uniref:uncharacterized protein isoform X2 n=1 Tax=Aquarana catesbeiana TaxID=8400 RepID=UPI003CCA057A
MAEPSIQVLRTFRDTLTFSEEEWMGLATWQKELYRTVMRDTAELFQSLGFMYQVKEELENGDGWAAQKSAEESLLTRESAIIEEISGENFIIQITEMSVIQDESTSRTATPFPSQPSQTSPNLDTLFYNDRGSVIIPEHSAKNTICEGTETFKMSENPEDGFFSLDTRTSTTLESPGGGLVSLDTKTFTTLESPGDGLISLDTETSTTPENTIDGLVSLNSETSTTLESPEDGLVSLDIKTFTNLESPGDGLVCLDAKTFTTLESTIDGLVSLDTKTFTTLESLFSLGTQTTTTLKNAGDGLVNQNTGTSIIPSLSGSHVVNNENFIKKDTNNRNEETCGPVSGLCNPTDVFTIIGEVQTPTSMLFSESDFLTLIQVENINVGSKVELSTIQTQLWDVHTGCSNFLEAHHQQSEAVFPVALVIPHNTIIPQHSWIGDQQTLIVDTPQWSRQFQVADCQQVDGKGDWPAPPAAGTRQDDLGAPLVEKSFQCSFCKKSFLYNQHLKNHEKIHREDKSSKQPTCETHGSSKQSLLGNQEAHPISSQSDHVVSTDGPLQSTKLFPCVECGRTFSYLFQFNRHQKIHARDKLLLRPVAPPPKKVYKLPQFLPARSREEDTKLDSTGDSCLKLHQHLQLSTAFLQNLLTSTAGFQYD